MVLRAPTGSHYHPRREYDLAAHAAAGRRLRPAGRQDPGRVLHRRVLQCHQAGAGDGRTDAAGGDAPFDYEEYLRLSQSESFEEVV